MDSFKQIFRAILIGNDDAPGLALPQPISDTTQAGKLVGAFCASLSGDDRREVLEQSCDAGEVSQVARLLLLGLDRIHEETQSRLNDDPGFAARVDAAAGHLSTNDPEWAEPDTVRAIWSVLFPEGMAGLEEGAELDRHVEELRARRRIDITALNPSPITDPAREIIFTSNVLLTVPAADTPVDSLDLSDDLKGKLKDVINEPQVYYYDHPINIGIPRENNEVIYGLAALDRAIQFEKDRGKLQEDAKVTVLLSLSVTHKGLQQIARQYLQEELGRTSGFPNLAIHVFSENDCEQMVQTVLCQADGVTADAGALLHRVFGVDGEYGRHYSFLKAMAAFWRRYVDPSVRATFKIDLDQVFDQEVLVRETGESALTHFCTPLWGATGVDADGNDVELGMIAGALVNEKDIGRSLFTPDVPFPDLRSGGEAVVFFSGLPMALSTRAEMMTRYRPDGPIDGQTACIHRYHVTGGTNGILIDSLVKHRPFTPTFVGRAEDQCYLMSVLDRESPGGRLRYVHKPGLIMRHDKEAFAGAAIAAATTGRFVGDLVRTFVFSSYAESLPWGFDRTKSELDPFTGCFITKLKYTVIFLRLAINAASCFAKGDAESGQEVLEVAAAKLLPLFERRADGIAEDYRKEREAWDLYYDLLGKQADEALLEEAAKIVSRCRITFE